MSAVRGEIDAVIAEIRQFISAGVSTEKPVDFGLVLQSLVQRAQSSSAVQIELRCDPVAAGRLVAAQAVQMANIAREALSNGLRHAKPERVLIDLHMDEDMAVLNVADDGSGFDPTSTSRSGVGIASMLSRAQEVGGTVEIQSAPGKGTRVVVRIPIFSSKQIRAGRGVSTEDES